MAQWTQQHSTGSTLPNLASMQNLLARGDSPLLTSSLAGGLTMRQLVQLMSGSQSWERQTACSAVLSQLPTPNSSPLTSSTLAPCPVVPLKNSNKRKIEDPVGLIPHANKRPYYPEQLQPMQSEQPESSLLSKLTKERDELSEALNASIQLVNRLRAVITKLKQGDPKSTSDDETDDTSRSNQRYWSAEEHQRFLEGVAKYGQKALKSIADHVGTRTPTQVRTHSQKYFLKLARKGCSSDECTGDDLSGNTESQSSQSPR